MSLWRFFPVVFLAVSACAAPEKEAVPETPAPTSAPSTPQLEEKKPAKPARSRKSDKTLPNTAKLMGLRPQDVQNLLGVPDLVHRAGHAQTMLYRGKVCVMDFVFYEKEMGGGFALNWFEARDFTGKIIEAAPCLQNLLPEGKKL